MSDIVLYSKEQFTDFYIPTTNLSNGAIVKTYSFNRNNYKNSIYVNLTFTVASGLTSYLKPNVYRGYYNDSGNLVYDKVTHNPVTVSGSEQQIVLSYQSLDERVYINYRVEFECVGNIETIDINEVGLLFETEINNKGIFGTKDRSIGLQSSNRQDINQNFSTYQTYSKQYAFTMLTNRENLDRIVNILESPFKLIDVKDECVDNSTRELSLTDISPIYATEAHQYIELQLKCIEEI